MNTIAVTIKGDFIIIKTPGPFAKETIKKVPGAWWKGSPLSHWRLPRSPAAAGILSESCNDDGIKIIVDKKSSEQFYSLVDQYTLRKDVQVHKTAYYLPLPRLTVKKPWLHQLRGYHFYKDLEAGMIPFDMGTGKSKLAIDLMFNNPVQPFRALIISPRYVVSVWPKQLKIHAPLPYAIAAPGKPLTIDRRIKRLQQEEDLAIASGKPFFAVINYEAVVNKKMQRYLLKRMWDFIICDESHRFKSPTGKQARFIRTQLRRRAYRRFTLSGTPATNTPLDIWSQYYFLDPAIFGTSYTRFRQKFCMIDIYGRPYNWLESNEMNRLFYSIAYQVRAQDVLDLPEKNHVELFCDFEPEARRVYNDMKSKLIAEVEDGIITAANAAVKLLRLLQITGGTAPTEGGEKKRISTAKEELLGELLEDLGPKEPLVVFAVFHDDLDAIKRIAISKGRTVGEMSGRTKGDQVQAWTNGEIDVLAAQIKSASLGVDFTRARYAAYYCPGYSAGDYDQSERRLWRPGQNHPVTYFRLMVRNTADAGAYEAIEGMLDIIEAILGVRKGYKDV